MPPYGAVEENERGKGGRQPSPNGTGGAEPRPYGHPISTEGVRGNTRLKSGAEYAGVKNKQ